jgi:poly-gamma-glutamate synthesis protein (capsule biosynthesis protein)
MKELHLSIMIIRNRIEKVLLNAGKEVMKHADKNRKPLFIFSLLAALACSPQIVHHSGDYIINKNEPIWETPKNAVEYGYRDSRYIKRIWPKKEPAVITAVGDVALNFATMKEILDSRARRHGRKNAMTYPFSKVSHEITGIGFCNLEAPVTDRNFKPFSDKDEVFYFSSPAGSEDILRYAGFDIASLANNHIKDCGEEGMFETAERIEKLNIAPVGIGKNIDEALKPVFMWHRGTRVAFFAFNNVVPKSVWAGPDRAGAAGGSDELMVAAVKKVKGEVDAIVVSIHWGQEVTSDVPVAKPEAEQVALGHKLIDAGASCILGHQSHGLGPVELYNNGIIFYSLGDFVFAGRHSAAHRTSMLARVTLSEKGLESYTLIPVNINPLEVHYSPEILSERGGAQVINRVLYAKDSRYSDYYEQKELALK